MKKSAKFDIGEKVRSKVDLTVPLKVLRIKDEGTFYSYVILDTYDKEHTIHESMLLKVVK